MESIDEMELRCRDGTSIETSNGPEPASWVNTGDSNVVRLPAPQLESTATLSDKICNEVCKCGWLKTKCPSGNCDMEWIPCGCDEGHCDRCNKIFLDCDCEDVEGTYSYCIVCGCHDCRGCGGDTIETVDYVDKIQKDKIVCDMCGNITVCGRNDFCNYKCKCYEKCEGCEEYTHVCQCIDCDYEFEYEEAIETRHIYGLTVVGSLLGSPIPLYRLLYDDVFTIPFLEYMHVSRINPIKLSLHMFKISIILPFVPVEIMDIIMEYVDTNVTQRIRDYAYIIPMHKMIQYV